MLTDSQKTKIRLFLGFPSIFRYKNARLESVMDNLDADAESEILALLTKLATVDDQILTVGLASAGLKRVDEIEWFGSGSNTALAKATSIGRTYIGRLSIIIGVPPYSDYYGPNGYKGDTFFPGFGSGGGNRGGAIPLG